jgi:serralysin
MLSTVAVADTGNVLMDALIWGNKWVGSTGPLQIKVGFKLIDGIIPTAAEVKAVEAVLAEFERVINVDFQYIGIDKIGAADLTFQIENDAWDKSFGWSVPAGETRYAAYGDANILRNNYQGDVNNFAKGGFDYITFLHEFAHVMGLAHPHDAGGGSGVFPGVTGENTIGQFGLNQGVYTTMSYNDGLHAVTGETPSSEENYVQVSSKLVDQTAGFVKHRDSFILKATQVIDTKTGLQGGLMALDVLALQTLYGANLDFAAGENQYVLPSKDGIGTSYISIWDTNGVDRLSNDSSADSTIDLRAATGVVGPGGGGFISSVDGVRGGFTIANGVVIENARGGSGDDQLFGNAFANILEAGAGNDRLTGFAGQDELWGEAGNDQFVFQACADSGPTILSCDLIKDFNSLDDVIDLTGIDANEGLAGNQSFQFIGAVSSFSKTGDLRVGYSSGNTVLYLNTDADMSSESVIVLSGYHTLNADHFLL